MSHKSEYSASLIPLIIPSPVPESGAQGQGIRTAYGLIPNYLDGEASETRDSAPSQNKEPTDNVKKEANVKLEMEEDVSFIIYENTGYDIKLN